MSLSMMVISVVRMEPTMVAFQHRRIELNFSGGDRVCDNIPNARHDCASTKAAYRFLADNRTERSKVPDGPGRSVLAI
jgi:hypothetical protein